MLVALTHQSMEEDVQLARKFPQLNLILGGHDHTPFAQVFLNLS
jgi:2',3'-cyclic-nucleotide 2'-phosphodiesterase (5'-nucleotidase family)